VTPDDPATPSSRLDPTAISPRPEAEDAAGADHGGPRPWRSIAVLGLLAAALVAGGYVYYRSEAAAIRRARHAEIAAIATLKADEIQRWRKERRADAELAAGSPSLREAVGEWSRTGAGSRLAERVDEELTFVREVRGCAEVRLVDLEGRLLASTVRAPDSPGPIETQAITAAVSSRGAVLGDLFRRPGRPVYLDAVASVLGRDGAALAVVVLRHSADEYLFPLIQSWPTPSRTAETLLVRREGADVLFLNELRHVSGTALILRVSMGSIHLPATQALLGRRGTFEGKDYRGIDVLADLRPVAGSPWFMVAKVDTAEILGEARYRAGVITGFVALSILLAAAASTALHHRRREAERRRSGAALQALAARQDALLAAIPDIVMETNEERAYTWANRAGLDFFGEDVVGREADLYREGEPETGEAVRPAFGGGEDVIHVESLQRRKDGAKRLLAWWSRALRDEAGHSRGALSSARDVTDLRQQERELRERNEELARFTYAVSHDLRSPLVTIKAFLGYLEKDLARPDAGRVEQDLAYIRGAADRMARLLDELLELARVGRKASPPEDVPLQAVVDEARALVAGRIAQRGVRVEATPEPIVLHGDRVRLVGVFQNLLDNAVKFMGDQAVPRIEVGAEDRDGEVVLFVRDNGDGIDPRHQSRLFGLFEKLRPETEGSGIGLAMVRRIVELHGGRVWIESAGSGQGATVLFTLAETRRT
jgi:PAS domain S-box-containing protein